MKKENIIQVLLNMASVSYVDACDDNETMFFVGIYDDTRNDLGLLLDTTDMDNKNVVYLVYETMPWEISTNRTRLKDFLGFVLANCQNNVIAHNDSDYGQGFWVYDIHTSFEDGTTATARFRFVAKIVLDNRLSAFEDTIDSFLFTYKAIDDFSENEDPSIDDAVPSSPITEITVDFSSFSKQYGGGNEKLDELIRKLKEFGFQVP